MVSLLVMQKLLVAVAVMVYMFVVPFVVSAAGLVPCGGAEPEKPCQTCDVVLLTNNVVAWLVMILGTIAAILIVVAGVRLVTSGGNMSAKEAAKSSMTNLLIGYLIVLSAWLVLDYGLKALLIQDGASSFGVWNTISCTKQPVAGYKDFKQEEVTYLPVGQVLQNVQGWVSTGGSSSGGTGAGSTGGSSAACTVLPGPGAIDFDCTIQQSQCRNAGGNPTISSGGKSVICTSVPAGGGGGGTGGSLPQCTNSACSVSALMGAGMTQKQANVMSCIAMTESSGNPNTPPYNVTHPGSNSSACGTFQIVRTTWNTYNSMSSCSNHATSCQNASCNMRVAVNLVRANGYRDWTCANCNAKAIQCISRYGG